jgi:hypothetical protein
MRKDLEQLNPEANEVIDVAYSELVLSGGELPGGVDALVLTSLLSIPSPEESTDRDGIGCTWRDILFQHEAEIFEARREKWGALKDYPFLHTFERLLNDLFITYEKRLATRYTRLFIHDFLAYYMTRCAESRQLLGRQSVFYELLFRIVKSGGYPCGWEGNYPEGRLIAYYPRKKRRSRKYPEKDCDAAVYESSPGHETASQSNC